MEDMEVLEQTEETTEQETEQFTQQEPETTTEPEQETETTTTTSSIDVAEGFPDLSENIVHELFAEFGVNLDYVPKNKEQMFAQGLEFIAAALFFWCFIKIVTLSIRNFLKW